MASYKRGAMTDKFLSFRNYYSIQAGTKVYFFNADEAVGSPRWLLCTYDYSYNFNQGFEDE